MCLRGCSALRDVAARGCQSQRKGECSLEGPALYDIFRPPDASVQWQPDGFDNPQFLGAGFLGAPPIFLTEPISWRCGRPLAQGHGNRVGGNSVPGGLLV